MFLYGKGILSAQLHSWLIFPLTQFQNKILKYFLVISNLVKNECGDVPVSNSKQKKNFCSTAGYKVQQWQWNTRQQVHSNWLINKQWHEAQPTQRKYQQLAGELHCLAKANVHTTYNDRWIPWTPKDIHIFHSYKSRHCDKEVDKLKCTHNTHQFQMINNTKLHTTANNSTKWEIDEKQKKKLKWTICAANRS